MFEKTLSLSRIQTTSTAVALILLAMPTGCSNSSNSDPKPTPPAPVITVIEESVADVKPSIEHLKVDGVIKEWSETPKIEWETAITLAALSDLAYKEASIRESNLKKLGFDEVIAFETYTKSGFLALQGDIAVIAFRGTAGMLDWVTNFKFRQRSSLTGTEGIHRGFLGAYNNFGEEIRELLAKRNPKRIWITGHSLGGAMAACCAFDLLRNDYENLQIVTFGQPRIGNEKLAGYLADKLGNGYLRVMNEADPVPKMPPSIGFLFPAYWHGGNRIRFSGDEIKTTQGAVAVAALPPSIDESEYPVTRLPKDECLSVSEEEFLELIKKLEEMKRENAVPMTSSQAGDTPTDPSMAVGSSYTGEIIGGIGDHYMDKYLAQLNKFRNKGLESAR